MNNKRTYYLIRAGIFVMIFLALLVKYGIKSESSSKPVEEVRVCAEVTHFEKTGVSSAYLHNKEKFQ